MSKKPMSLDTKKIHFDILKRLNSINKPQRHLTEKIGISRATFWRLSKGHDITTSTFFILVEWLEKDINRYIKNINHENKTKR